MQLKISDVARIMRVTEHVVKQWIGNEGLSSQRVQHVTWVDRQDLLEWALTQGLTIHAELLNGSAPFGGQQALYGSIEAGLTIRTSSATLERDIARLGQELYYNEPALAADFVDRFGRSDLTGFFSRNGTAIPHPRSPLVARVSAPRLVICYLHRPLPLLANSSSSIETLVAVVAINAKEHVGLTVALSNQLADARFQELLGLRADVSMLANYLARNLRKEVKNDLLGATDSRAAVGGGIRNG